MSDDSDLWPVVCELDALVENWALFRETTRQSVVRSAVAELKCIHREVDDE